MSWLDRIFPAETFADASSDLAQEMTPRPRLAAVRHAPSRDDFLAWRDEPVTKFIMAALVRNADECAQQWMLASWEGGTADQRTLDGLRERADALRGIAEADYEAFCETLGLEPQA
jgi:hypothetical protein